MGSLQGLCPEGTLSRLLSLILSSCRASGVQRGTQGGLASVCVPKSVVRSAYPARQAKHIPPGTKPRHAEKFLWKFVFARIHAGPVFALARIKANSLEELVSAYLPNSWGNSFRCEYMPRLYSHPREHREKNLVNYFGIGLVPTHSSGLLINKEEI